MNRDLGTGLVLRSISAGFASDRRDLPAFYTEVFSEANGEPDPYIGLWTETLLADDHPTTTGDDIWVVVDSTQDDRIVSALLLIPQTWRYESIQMPVGRVEIVATHPDYRRRGLVRALMQAAHERSAALGHNVQAITGIPHYYRQFGYTMAVDLGGYEAIPLAIISPAAADSAPAYSLRPATPADIPALVAWDRYAGDHALLTTVRSESEWAYEFTRDPSHIWWLDLLIVTDQHGADVGYIALRQKAGSGQNTFVQCLAYVVGDQASYLATYEDVLHGLKTHLQKRYPDDTPAFIHFIAGIHEGFTALTRARYPAATRDHVYAWYMRIADLPRFMHNIAPVLEQRLQHSAAHRFSGDLTIAFYDSSALRLRFDQGRLVTAETVHLATPQADESADAHLPWNLFFALIFGYRTFEDLAFILPDCEANGKARLLFQVLFPRKRSWIMPIA